MLNGPSRLLAGNTHSPDAVHARPSNGSRAASPSRTCLGPVFASIRVKRSGLTSHHRRQRISPAACTPSAGTGAPPQRRPAFRLRAGAGAELRRVADRAADGGSGRSPCTGSPQLRADGPTRRRSRTCCAVSHDCGSRRPAFAVCIRGRSGQCRRGCLRSHPGQGDCAWPGSGRNSTRRTMTRNSMDASCRWNVRSIYREPAPQPIRMHASGSGSSKEV